jgi:polyisoprenoid-binding protein YceI
MYAALKAKENPAIVFRLRSVEVGDDLSVKAVGVLSIAGTEREVDLAAAGTRVDGAFRVRGSEKLLMTDFGIKPPSMMLGAIKTKNEVTVHFDIVLSAR